MVFGKNFLFLTNEIIIPNLQKSLKTKMFFWRKWNGKSEKQDKTYRPTPRNNFQRNFQKSNLLHRIKFDIIFY